jgi:hypothetical protein
MTSSSTSITLVDETEWKQFFNNETVEEQQIATMRERALPILIENDQNTLSIILFDVRYNRLKYKYYPWFDEFFTRDVTQELQFSVQQLTTDEIESCINDLKPLCRIVTKVDEVMNYWSELLKNSCIDRYCRTNISSNLFIKVFIEMVNECFDNLRAPEVTNYMGIFMVSELYLMHEFHSIMVPLLNAKLKLFENETDVHTKNMILGATLSILQHCSMIMTEENFCFDVVLKLLRYPVLQFKAVMCRILSRSSELEK